MANVVAPRGNLVKHEISHLSFVNLELPPTIDVNVLPRGDLSSIKPKGFPHVPMGPVASSKLLGGLPRNGGQVRSSKAKVLTYNGHGNV